MADKKLILLSTAPHIRTRLSVPVVMWTVVGALLPAAAWAVYAFGMYAGIVMLVSVGAAVLTELALNLLLRRPVTIGDGSAFLTGLLVAFNMPASTALPLYIPVTASVFAIAVAKYAFGGLGHNWMNPALAGRIFVFFAWLTPMTSGWSSFLNPDVVSRATPLKALKFGGDAVNYLDLFLGKVPGCIGEVSAAALLLGGLFLIIRKIVNWEIPVAYFGSAALLAWIFGGLAVSGAAPAFFTGDPLFHLLSGGLMLGALFMATDWVTSPMTFKGRIIYGIGCGALTILIRLTARNVEGVSFAIVLMNITVPLIDRITGPKRFGVQKKGGAA